jgi:NADH-quinone oxidoreductase subunit E
MGADGEWRLALAWKTINRNEPVIAEDASPLLSEAVKEKIRSFFPRYPTKRAALLPALRVAQEALGHLHWQAQKEIAELLGLPASQVFDLVSFYAHFWAKDKGRKLIVLCRSLSCDVMGSDAVAEAIQKHLGIGEHETTPDGQYSFMLEECLGACECAPCMLINERLHKCVKPEDVPRILADPDNDKVDFPRSDLYDAPQGSEGATLRKASGQAARRSDEGKTDGTPSAD